MADAPELYTEISAFEPLLPDHRRNDLAEITCQILREAGRLEGLLPAVEVRERISQLIREMNSYYSNLIEGHKIFPKDIEAALNEEFSAQPDQRAHQWMARAHIEVEKKMVDRLEAEPDLDIHSAGFIQWLHRESYEILPEELRIGRHKDGRTFPVTPGEFRNYEVGIGSHQPPFSGAVPRFIERFGDFYRSRRIIATNQLVALAAAHHRLVWIHPFGDGNGRVARLHTHAWLTRCQVGAFGLWTISRGFARNRKEYYRHLSLADSQRRNDSDGRGNLSDQGLAEHCHFFLDTILDQIRFMGGLLDLSSLSRRIEAHLHVHFSQWKTPEREQVGRLLKSALVRGQVKRGEVPGLIGRKATTASRIIHLAIESGLAESIGGERGPLSLVFDSRTLDSYFPALYQDLPAGE